MLEPLPLDVATTWVLVGLVHLALGMAVWNVLTGRHDRRSTLLWCSGSAMAGVMMLVYAARSALPHLPMIVLANVFGYAGFALRWSALRRERGVPNPWLRVLLLVVVACITVPVLDAIDERVRLLGSLTMNMIASLALCHEAHALGRDRISRSAGMVSWSYGIVALALFARLVVVFASWASIPGAITMAFDTELLLLAWMLASLWGNLGYVGFAIEMTERRARLRGAQLADATERREQAEQQAQALRALSDERHELLRVISHEVRQPLHNAQAVLQGAADALQDAAAQPGLDRARAVLREITRSLDNTLAVSTRLIEERAPPLRDTDLEMLIELVLGDLPAEGRSRVRVRRDSAVRTAAMDVGLMRLALRNLLSNALAYATPGSPVTLSVSDSEEPLALVFEVADEGPGIPPGLLPRLFERGVRGRHDVHGQGLGLFIVRRALQMQGGTAEVRSGAGGSVFTLTVPQGQETG
ncbi:signal transduction histidine kinase [Rubrivivax gelatinosus]|uniref:sensor histidine kinase n=1 Tax=Rubrivivax gelatinosus TaxID=28068 RepID=UPI0018CA4146|nr:HAMP domain-containing sensor histidine kinase [Rubrivivax gelatinosus]MBG6081733.1 signal transduction histidine kinase [Rubrivivax gelatinosus]